MKRLPLPWNIAEWAQPTSRVHLKEEDAVFGAYLHIGVGADVRYDSIKPPVYRDPDQGEDYLVYEFKEPFLVPLDVNDKLFVYTIKDDIQYYWYIREDDRIFRVFVGMDSVNVWIVDPMI